MNRLHHIFLFVSFFLVVCSVQAEDYFFRHISMEQGLPQMSVADVYQDSEGYMWFATRQGAARYDGRNMEVFNPNASDLNSLLSPVVEQIEGDTLTNIYIRTTGINRYHLRTNRMHMLCNQTVSAMTATADGLYFTAEGYLYTYNAHTDSVQRVCALPDVEGICILRFLHGILYIGTVEGRLYSLTYTHSLTLLYELGSQISCIYENRSHNTYVGTWADGLYLLKTGGIEHLTTRDGLVSDFVRDVYEDSHNKLWIGTDIGLQRLPDLRLFMSGQSIWRLTADKGGNLWAGTYFNGVYFFNPAIDYYATIPLPFEDFPVISHIQPLPNHLLVLSTEGDGLYITTDGGEIISHLDIPNIKSTYYDADRAMLYLGTHLHGLYTVSLAPLQHATLNTKLSTLNINHYDLPFPHRNGCQIVRSILPSGDSLLLGTHNGVFSFSPADGTFRLLSQTLDSVITKVVSMALSEDSNTLYVGGEQLVCYDRTHDRVQTMDHLPFRNIEKLLLDRFDRLWVGTDGNGVWQCRVKDLQLETLKPETLVAYTSRTCGLQNDYVRNLLVTPMGHLMVVTTRGFSIILSHDSTAAEPYPVINYSPGTYLPLTSLYNGGVALAPNGDILLAGMDGMIQFREEHLRQLPVEPTIVLEHPYQYIDKITLSHHQRDISLHYSIQTNNLYPESMFLRYSIACRYNASTQELNDWTGDIRLMNLRYGTNKLELQVLDRQTDSVLTRRTLSIRVRPPFYISWPAIVLYILMVIAAIALGIYYLRRHYLRALQIQEQDRYQALRNDIDTYIDAHLSDAELDVSRLCRQLGIGRTRLFQIFREVYGTSPQQLIAERRLQRAAEWLLNRPECNISEIAYDLGFQSPKYFSHCFKERYGKTPSAYRKEH
ncbi:MAG: helix-turn-helix domain-containing protein [Paludibacteraceae bacterium]|nr:helix-turn-helix domain-containing protein [Paludibacteraceae bacterium]